MNLYLCSYRNGNAHKKVVVMASNPEEAQSTAALLLESKKLEWKPANTEPEIIRGLLFTGSDATIIREEEAVATV